MTMTDFQPTAEQGHTMMILADLIGLSGVHKAPRQGDSIVFDLLPAHHVVTQQPFCVRVTPDGRMERITDDEAGVDRP